MLDPDIMCDDQLETSFQASKGWNYGFNNY